MGRFHVEGDLERPGALVSKPVPLPGCALAAGEPWTCTCLSVGIVGAQVTPASPHIAWRPNAVSKTWRSWAIVSLPWLSTVAIVMPRPSRPASHSGWRLYEAQID